MSERLSGRLRRLSEQARPGPWVVRQGMDPDRFEPDGYRYVQFGPTEAKAHGYGTDQLSPADARLIAAAVNYVRAALASQSKETP